MGRDTRRSCAHYEVFRASGICEVQAQETRRCLVSTNYGSGSILKIELENG